MKQEVKEFAVEKAKEMMNAFSCSPEAKAAAESWLAALGTEAEQAETEKFFGGVGGGRVAGGGLRGVYGL